MLKMKTMRRLRLTVLAVGTLLGIIGHLEAAAPEPKPLAAREDDTTASSRRLPGQQVSGEILLPTQWSLLPVGDQIPLGDFPVNIALHPTEPWAAVLHAGYGD